MNTKALRAANREIRSQLSAQTIASGSLDVTARLWRIPVLSRSRRIACYLSVGGEVDCQYAARIAWDRGREVFLPVIRGRELMFAPYLPDSRFLLNRYGIPEPTSATRCLLHPREIDVVLTPLVAFDEYGNRLGMGAGFYDRSFRIVHQRKQWSRPHLIGLAYEFQKASKLKASSWDVPLQAVVTEKDTYTF
jgi:5-formyltetrahydrofolate cyclo-ligase